MMVLTRVSLDHHLLLIRLNGAPPSFTNKPFRFEASWLKDDNFSKFLKLSWENNRPFQQNISKLSLLLPCWNINVFRNIYNKKRSLMARLNGIQRACANGFNPFLDNLEKDLQKELGEVLAQ